VLQSNRVVSLHHFCFHRVAFVYPTAEGWMRLL
jgi:hypothetical protein